jgi:murein DD-endopeptidase MepM/ murein hydrolase activator NlpD
LDSYVRFFPRTQPPSVPNRSTRFRTLLVCTVLLATGAAAVAPTAMAKDLRDRQHDVHSKVRSAQGELNESSKALASAARRLSRTRAALASAQRRLSAAQAQVAKAVRLDQLMQARLEAAEHKLALARVALDAARRRVRVQRAAIGELAASNYANGDPKLMGLAVMLNSTDPAEVTSQMNTIDSLMNKQTQLLKDLKQARAQMVAEEAKVEKAKQAVAVQRKQARANLVRRQGLERSAAEAKAEVAKLVIRDRAAQAQATQARRADLAQLSVLKKQEDRIRAQILERARRQRAAAGAGGGGGFKGNSGTFLQRPVPGVITSPFGYRRHPIYGYWGLHDGTDFSAPCGMLNRAAGSGTVVSEIWSDVYGNRLYLDLGQVNGKNMTVVYNHLSGYRARAGQHVSRGEVVGYTGTTGWSTGCHLHFTVLLDGSPVNPMNYL